MVSTIFTKNGLHPDAARNRQVQPVPAFCATTGCTRSAPVSHLVGDLHLTLSTHDVTELEFHISPAPNSSRPQTGLGTDGTTPSRRRQVASSKAIRTGPATASAMPVPILRTDR